MPAHSANHTDPLRMLPNTYAGGTLDRATAFRKDAAWLAQAWARADAEIVPLWRGQCLVTPDARQAARIPAAHIAALRRAAQPDADPPWALLGISPIDTAPIFALDLSASEHPHPLLPPNTGSFTDLRTAAPLLPIADAALLAYARALLDWRRRARFCGVCGAPCRAEQAGHVSVCTACATAFFPRTDPTVIMLVTRGDAILLGHNARFPTRTLYSALAGFVEPGESLEEAVAREVMEETGIAIGAVRYHSSQPWPFPANLMLGFLAEALTETIQVDTDELLDARWFTRAELRDPAAGIDLPPAHSIARRMIQEWLDAPGAGNGILRDRPLYRPAG